MNGMFKPAFTITPAMAKVLMSIEADRLAVDELPMDVAMLAGLRESAKLLATHYSTQIEGNRLTQQQVAQAVAGSRFPGRERDESEVRHYYQALREVERLASQADQALTEMTIQVLHGLVMSGKAAASPYRDGQNVIRDSQSGGIVYLPPESADVPALMADLVAWIQEQITSNELPVPLIAGIAHYQFATIHPYYDGNGRTARLLTTLILHKSGYGLKGIYSLEEYYARDLPAYYAAIAVGPSHNYYIGRAEADITPFLTYFCHGMAESFSSVRARAVQAAHRGATDLSPEFRKLDPHQRQLLQLFRKQGTATTAEMAAHLGLSPRTVVSLCRDWVAGGFLAVHQPARKNRSYRLADAYERMMG